MTSLYLHPQTPPFAWYLATLEKIGIPYWIFKKCQNLLMEWVFPFFFFFFFLIFFNRRYCQTFVGKRGEWESSPPNLDVTLMTSLYLHPQTPTIFLISSYIIKDSIKNSSTYNDCGSICVVCMIVEVGRFEICFVIYLS